MKHTVEHITQKSVGVLEQRVEDWRGYNLETLVNSCSTMLFVVKRSNIDREFSSISV